MRFVFKIWIVSLIIYLSGTQNIYCQTSSEAGAIVIETDKLSADSSFIASIKETDYYRLSDDYLKAIEIELAISQPDSIFIGQCYLKTGNVFKQFQQFKKAVESYKSATRYFKTFSAQYVEAASAISRAYKMAYDKAEYIAPVENEKKIIDTCFFLITKILSREGKIMMVEIAGGQMDGLFKESAVNAFSSYNKDMTRGNEFIGRGEIKEIGNFTSICELSIYDTSSYTNLAIEGDRIEAQTFMKPNDGADLLHKIAIFNIIFTNNYNEPLFFPWQILQNDDPELVGILYNAMTFCVQEMAEFTTEYTDVYTKGCYIGMNCTQAMMVTEPCDIDEFMNFVKSYPARYIGKEWKISETHATWIIYSSFEGNAYPQFIKWIFQKQNKGVLKPFISRRPGYFTKSRVLSYYETYKNLSNLGLNDSALKVTDLLLEVSMETGNDSLQSMLHEVRGLSFFNSGNSQAAIDEFSQSIRLNPENANSFYYRGYLYGKLNNYRMAVEDYQSYTNKLPDNSNGWSNLGWFLILEGKVFDAQTACLKAYEMDSMNRSSTVNLGHICLFMGDTAKAHYYYNRSLELLSTVKDFNDGLLSDFDIFLKNNWQVKNVIWAKDLMQTHFKKHYEDNLLSNELFKIAVDESYNENYTGLINNMKHSLAYQVNSAIPNPQTIHNIYSWLGYGYQYLLAYDSSDYYYNLSLQMAKNVLKNDKDVQNNLELLRWMYETAGNNMKSNQYLIEYQAVTQKIEDQGKKKNLYFISVGIDAYKNFSFNSASSDAMNIAKSIETFSRQGYDSLHIVVLKNDQAKRENIQKEFEKIVSQSSPYDMFIFYFAGYCGSVGSNSFIATAGFETDTTNDDYLKNTISAFSLQTMLNSVPARKQLLIFDAGAQKFVNHLISIRLNKNSNLTESDKSLFIFCPTETRIELSDKGQGLLTSTIIEGIEGKADDAGNQDGIITAKEMDGYIFKTMSNPSWYLNFNSYTSGRDFPVAFLLNYENKKDSVQQQTIQATRGGALFNEDISAAPTLSSERTDYALIFATDNYDEWQKLKNPVYDGTSLANILENEYGFKVEIIKDATRRIIQDKIIAYKKRNYHSGDQLFIFFAGHGLYDEENMQEGYIVAKDSKLDDPYKDSYVPFSFVRDHTDGNCPHVLLVLDVCYGGTFSQRLNPMHRGSADIYQKADVAELRNKISSIKSRYYITSGNKEYVADGAPGKHSPFASFLIDGLSQGVTNKSKYLTYNDLVTFIDQIKTSTPTHSFYGESEPGGNFIFEIEQKSNKGSMKDDQDLIRRP